MKTKVKSNQARGEKGITLIALLVMVIVLIMISAVVIRGLTNDKLIDTSMTTVDEYNIASYKEQVEQAVRGIVLKNAAGGRDTSIGSLAEEMAGTETIWVKTAIASDGNANNPDMLVTVVDGYVYQVYYDSTYGAVFTEYVGKDDGKGFPSLKSSYKVSTATMTVIGKAEEGEALSSIELIYKGEVVNQEAGKDTANFNLADVGTGWYIVKATSSSGKVRYNWVRVTNVSDRLVAPVITVKAANGDKNASGWYNETNGEVTVTISAQSETASKIKYWQSTGLSSDTTQDGTTVSDRTAEIKLTDDGMTTITAKEMDDEGNESQGQASETIKIDKVKPNIRVTQKIGENAESTAVPKDPQGWYNKNVEVTVEVTDNGSGEDGYEYSINQGGVSIIAGESWTKQKMQDKILFNKEGENSVAIRGLDVAGNTSSTETVIVRLDKTEPKFQDDLIITDINTTSFKVKGTATDSLSGSTAHQGNITYACEVRKIGIENETVGEVSQNEGEEGSFTVTGLTPNGQYEVIMKATDKARK